MANDRKYGAPVNVVAGGASYVNAAVVTPSDSDPLATDAASLWIGGAGDVALVTLSGQSVTFSSVPAGTLLPVAASRVKATGTTATDLVALW